MASQANEIIFVDLFAGSGLYTIGHQKEKFAATSLASLANDLPLSKWIFCERDSDSARALKIRVNKYFKGRNILIFEDELGPLAEKLVHYIPTSKAGYRVAVFCVVDPFSFEIPFSILDKLHALGCSFVIPFTFCINDHHNHRFHLHEHREKLRKFMGGFKDVENLDQAKSNMEFYKRMVKLYQNNMLVLGLNSSLTVQRLDSGLMELPMYYLGLFSRHSAVKTIQREVQESMHYQTHLF